MRGGSIEVDNVFPPHTGRVRNASWAYSKRVRNAVPLPIQGSRAQVRREGARRPHLPHVLPRRVEEAEDVRRGRARARAELAVEIKLANIDARGDRIEQHETHVCGSGACNVAEVHHAHHGEHGEP